MAPKHTRDDLLYLLCHAYMTLNDLCFKLRDAMCKDLDDVLMVIDKENAKRLAKEQQKKIKKSNAVKQKTEKK